MATQRDPDKHHHDLRYLKDPDKLRSMAVIRHQLIIPYVSERESHGKTPQGIRSWIGAPTGDGLTRHPVSVQIPIRMDDTAPSSDETTHRVEQPTVARLLAFIVRKDEESS
jgi:hypothetical protein